LGLASEVAAWTGPEPEGLGSQSARDHSAPFDSGTRQSSVRNPQSAIELGLLTLAPTAPSSSSALHALSAALPGADTDPLYSNQWHLAACKIPEAWAWLEANGLPPGGSRDVVVAVIDTGVDYTHPDLAANMWTNSRETGTDAQGRDKRTNGVDDDGNGFVDDVQGCNVVGTHSGNPMDDHGHGTHVAGIIAAQAGNGQGGVGVAYNVQIMAIKAAQYSGLLAPSPVDFMPMPDRQQPDQFVLQVRAVDDSVVAHAQTITLGAGQLHAAVRKRILAQGQEGFGHPALQVLRQPGELFVKTPLGDELKTHPKSPCSRNSISTGRSGSTIRALAIAASSQSSSQSVSSNNSRPSFSCSACGSALIWAMTSFALIAPVYPARGGTQGQRKRSRGPRPGNGAAGTSTRNPQISLNSRHESHTES
jgi:subtilisin family serine protease